MTQIIHNPRCSKSRQTLSLLDEKEEQIEIIEYLKTPLTKAELQSIIKKLGISAVDLIRRGETKFKEEFKGKALSEDQWIDAMVKYPILIERPIVIKGNKAIIGRPPEKILDIL